MFRWCVTAAIAATLTAVAAAQDLGDPCWCEATDGGGDAGSLPQTAQTTMGEGRPVLRCIEGMIDDVARQDGGQWIWPVAERGWMRATRRPSATIAARNSSQSGCSSPVTAR